MPLNHMTIEKLAMVTKRQVYGEDKYYPANEAAQMAADLAGTKTLTHGAIRLLKDYGFTVEVVAESLTL